jgi:hypothetical protein
VTFGVRLQRELWPILLLFGVRPGAAWVRIARQNLVARFGFFRAETPVSNSSAGISPVRTAGGERQAFARR